IERARSETHGATSDVRLFANNDGLAQFINTVQTSVDAGHQLCLWEDSEFELTGDVDEQLALLQRALEARKKPQVLVRYDQVYDLSNYSARVEEIGKEKPYYSAFITKPDAEPWAPETVQYGMTFTPQGETEPVAIPFSESTLNQLREKVAEARAASQT